MDDRPSARNALVLPGAMNVLLNEAFRDVGLAGPITF